MNDGFIVEAALARLRNTDPEAVALKQGPRLLRDITASLGGVMLTKIRDFAEAFRLLPSDGPDNSALLLILSQELPMGHVVIITNEATETAIIEAQHWGPTYPQTVFYGPAEAEARYGTQVALWFGMVPLETTPM